MARGNIYYISKDVHENVSFDESEYQEKLDIIGTDYIKNMTNEESEPALNCLSTLMYSLGAIIGYGYDNKEFAFSFRFEKTEKVKQDYFRPKLDKLKSEVEALTLFDVIHHAPVFDNILNNQCGDLITLNDGTYHTDMTVDEFIRELEPGVIYYVYQNVLMMH